MKKVIKKSDGSTETIIGSPEEIRRYEEGSSTVFPTFPHKYTPWQERVNPFCPACCGNPWFGVIPPECICVPPPITLTFTCTDT